ncbi:MAG: ABC transporter ATP-binding protein [Phycisphaerae bacterium]|nr:ABC transporter ATP-binding protein [Phycisphaerae bacterium]
MGRGLLEVEGLKTYYPIRKGLLGRTAGYVKAVDGVSFAIEAGRTLGLVGESGCGKTTVARSIVRLVSATAGRIRFGERDVLSAGRDELRRIRSEIGLVFQDSYGSLNPRMTAGAIVGEPLKVRGRMARREIGERVVELLGKVGLSAAQAGRYPHEFSGGQRQRIGLARALALGPRLLICDEPVSSLDVSIRARILNLLKDLQEELGFAVLFIAHDPAVVEFFCDVVAVMYKGRIV